jgi:hypothetical protein
MMKVPQIQWSWGVLSYFLGIYGAFAKACESIDEMFFGRMFTCLKSSLGEKWLLEGKKPAKHVALLPITP